MFLKKFWNLLDKKTNIFRIQVNISIMCRDFCIGLIDFMLARQTLIDYTSLFSPYDFGKNDKRILSYFENEWISFYWSN